MKLLTILFFVGLSLTSARRFSSQEPDFALDNYDELDIWDSSVLQAVDDSTGSDVIERLRESLENVVEKIRKFIDEGKVTADDVFERLVERVRKLRQELGNRKEELRVKGREVLDEVRSRVRELRERWERKLREIFGFDSKSGGMYVEAVQSDRDQDEESRTLRERLDEIVRRIKDALDNGESVKEALEQLKELRQKLREKKIEFQGKFNEVVERLREKVREWLRKVFGNNDSGNEGSVSFREYLRRLRQWIVDEFDIEKLEKKVEEYFGKGSEVAERILQKLRVKGENVRQRILSFVDRLLGEKQEKRSIKEKYEKIRDYLEGLGIKLKEKYVKFGEWAKWKYEEGLERGVDRVERIKKLAREYLNDLKRLRNDIREQGYYFFMEYKEELKSIWDDIQEKIQEIRNQE